MKIITSVNDKSNRVYRDVLLESCRYFNLNIHTAHCTPDSKWESHRQKDKHLYDFLAGCAEDEIVLFTDGFDTCFLSDEKEILEKYYSFNSEIVVSAEINCSPCYELKEEYSPVDSPYKFLNSGGLIGRAGSLMKVVENFQAIDKNVHAKKYSWSNQFLWTISYLQQIVPMMLDSDCLLFQTFATEMNVLKNIIDAKADHQYCTSLIKSHKDILFNDFSFQNGRVFNKVTKTTPSHLHFNSPVLKKVMLGPRFSSVFPWVN